MALDERGARPDKLEAALRAGARAALLTPRAQNPTGAAWDPERAGEIGSVLARRPGVLVIEDDHAGPASGAPAVTSCRGLERWAIVRSVSKWLSPDLRLAVLAGDPATVARVEGRQALGMGWVSYLIQDAVAELWADPAVTAGLDRAAAVYAHRGAALRRALSAGGLTATGSSGLTTWVTVADEAGVVAGLLEQGWAVSPGQRFRIASTPGIRVGFAGLRPGQAGPFAEAVSACVHQRPRRSD